MVRKSKRILALIVATSALLTACAGDVEGAEGLRDENDKLNEFRAKTLVVGTTATMPPIESVDEATGEIVGLEPSLVMEIGKRLDLDIEIKNVEFSGLLSGLASGQFDMAFSGLADTAERQEAMDFVDWYEAGVEVIIREDDKEKFTNLDSLCGSRLGGTQDSTEWRRMNTVAEQCGVATEVIPAENSPVGLTMLTTGRMDSFAVNFPSAQGYVDGTPGTVVLEGQWFPVKRGIAFAKTSKALSEAFRSTLQDMMDDGSYQRILDEWGVGEGAVSEATINDDTKLD